MRGTPTRFSISSRVVASSTLASANRKTNKVRSTLCNLKSPHSRHERPLLTCWRPFTRSLNSRVLRGKTPPVRRVDFFCWHRVCGSLSGLSLLVDDKMLVELLVCMGERVISLAQWYKRLKHRTFASQCETAVPHDDAQSGRHAGRSKLLSLPDQHSFRHLAQQSPRRRDFPPR
jgi:hypothetical protein